MQLQITHKTTYAYSQAVPVCHNRVHLAPRLTKHQSCHSYQLLVDPEPPEISRHEDTFGNLVDYFAIHQAHRGLTVTSTSRVEVTGPELPLDVEASLPWEDVVRADSTHQDHLLLATLPFRFASRLTPIGAEYADYARESFRPGRPIVAAAEDLTARIHHDFKYDPKATTVSTPVEAVFANRAGVCQDFAHLGNACLRSLGLAARYVSGYLRTLPPPGQPRLVGADASHAWFSLYCGALGWVDFDPTNNMIPSTDHVTVAVGRDYHDCCPVRGVFVGGGKHSMNVSVDVMPIESLGS